MNHNDCDCERIDLETIVRIRKLYERMGTSLQNQLDDVLMNCASECNNNALHEIKRMFLSKLLNIDLVDSTSVEDAILSIDMELEPSRFDLESE